MAQVAASPGALVQHVHTTVVGVRDGDDDEVHTHQEVSYSQVGDQQRVDLGK